MQLISKLLLSVLILNSINLSSQKTWVGGNGNWNVASNWSPAGIPGTSDSCILGSGEKVTIPNGYTASVKGVLVNNESSLKIDGSLIVDAGGLNTALKNQAEVIVNGTLITADTGGSSTEGHGINNDGDILNNGTIIISDIIDNHAIRMGTGSIFDNTGTISIIADVGGRGIANSGTFNNYQYIFADEGTISNEFIKSDFGTFTNHTCAVLSCLNNGYAATMLSNDGLILTLPIHYPELVISMGKEILLLG